jgi:membrane associated rhomboid family serine protease
VAVNEELHDGEPVHRLSAGSPPRPIATMLVLGVTTIVTIVQFLHPDSLNVFGRRPGALAAGEWWRVVSPLFVHSRGLPHLLFNLAWIGTVGVIDERIFGSRRWLVLYFLPGIIGEFIAFAWKPEGGGASLGGSGLLGGLCVWLLLRGQSWPWRIRIWGPVCLVAALVLTIRQEIHGPPALVGACVAAVILRGMNDENRRANDGNVS